VLFWVITQRGVVIPYRLFGTTYLAHLQGPRIEEEEEEEEEEEGKTWVPDH
jgi:hypothetical protein